MPIDSTEDEADPFGDGHVPVRTLARDALRLLVAATAAHVPRHTFRAAERLREVLRRQLDDGDRADLLDDVDADPTDENALEQLRAAVEAALAQDPDFARDVLRCVNADCLVEHGEPDPDALHPTLVGPPADPRSAPSSPERLIGAAGVALVVLVAVAAVVRFWPQERSVEAYCATWRTEGAKLHARWAARSRSDDPFAGIATVAAAPRDLADFFDDLEQVAPEEIRPDVARVRDGWRAAADRLGDAAADPLGALAATALVGLGVSGAEQRVDRWTSAHCGASRSR